VSGQGGEVGTRSVLRATCHAEIIRADGTREPLGLIGAYDSRPWWLRAWHALIGKKVI
jgi:hypothetical protein